MLPSEGTTSEVREEHGTQPQAEVRSGFPQGPQQLSLEDLIRLVGPLAESYFEHQERAHQRELLYDTEELRHEVSWRKTLLVTGGILGTAVFAIAGMLFYVGRDQTASDLIKLVVALAGAAFGGYGVARGRERNSKIDE
jgi:hypothetical protein